LFVDKVAPTQSLGLVAVVLAIILVLVFARRSLRLCLRMRLSWWAPGMILLADMSGQLSLTSISEVIDEAVPCLRVFRTVVLSQPTPVPALLRDDLPVLEGEFDQHFALMLALLRR
jgi:hypothetical protein